MEIRRRYLPPTGTNSIRLSRNIVLATVTAVGIDIPFNVIGYIDNSVFSYVSATGVITVKKSGVYIFNSSYAFVANAVGVREVMLNISSLGILAYEIAAPTMTAARVLNGCWCVPLNANDTVTFRTLQNSGGALNVSIGAFSSAVRIGDL